MSRKSIIASIAVVAVAAALSPLLTRVHGAATGQAASHYVRPLVGPYFRPDYMFKGSSLNGWRSMGQAEWKANNGEIVGTPKSKDGGWLILNKSLQDVAFYAQVECTAGCDAGVLLRMQKTPTGAKGVFASLAPGDLGLYAITVDSQGHITSRSKLSPVPPRTLQGGVNPNIVKYYGGKFPRMNNAPPLPPGVNLPSLTRPQGNYRPGQWNGVDIFLSQNTFTRKFNAGGLGERGGTSLLRNVNDVVSDSMGNYGPIALYAGGTSAVHLKYVSYKDVLVRDFPHQYVSPGWTMQRLNPWYYSWSTAVADFNHDGIPDIVAGPYVYFGPSYTKAEEFMPTGTYNPTTQYAQESMVELAADVTGDGWPDIMVDTGNAGAGTLTLYVNPKGQSRRWTHYVVIPKCGNEFTLMTDLFKDGKHVIVHSGDNMYQYSYPNPANPTGFWITKNISKPGPWGMYIGHGFGVGDINGDGRNDLVSPYGWWEQPPNALHTDKTWTYHPVAFGRWGHSQGGAGGSQMGVYDVNGDGLNDVVTSLEGHGFGLAWFEQKRSGGKISFVEHMIMDNYLTKNAGNVTFAELHADAYADMNGDGIPDIITGKRSMSHLASFADPDSLGSAVLYVYHTVRDPNAPGGAKFVPQLINNDSGVGSTVTVAKLTKNGKPDIITSGALGTFIFWNHEK